jgi:hypothetical protein
MWVAILKCMEAMLGISLHGYLYHKLAKHCIFLIISYVLAPKKLENRAEQVLPGSREWEKSGGRKVGPNNVYTCK